MFAPDMYMILGKSYFGVVIIDYDFHNRGNYHEAKASIAQEERVSDVAVCEMMKDIPHAMGGCCQYH